MLLLLAILPKFYWKNASRSGTLGIFPSWDQVSLAPWVPGRAVTSPPSSLSHAHSPVILFQLLKHLLDNQPTRDGAKEK